MARTVLDPSCEPASLHRNLRKSDMKTVLHGADGSAISADAIPAEECAAPNRWGGEARSLPMGSVGRSLRAAGRRGAKSLAHAILPQSVVAWKGRPARMAARGQHRRPVALTFDDGPGDLTRAYLEVLESLRVRATFFVVGEVCAAYPELVSAIAAGGHELGGHGYTHRRFTSLGARELRRELTHTAALLPRPSGRRPLVRPPHGDFSLSSILTCAMAGFTTVLWSHDSGDWCSSNVDKVCAAFEDGGSIEAGAIVLLHEGQPWTLRALSTVLGKLSKAGHDFVTVGELLGY
jgi:peptidoglycan/xylan/chitin deacetylase (PgdA/CDA1 family)